MKIVMFSDFFGLNCSYQENLLTEYYTKMGHEVVVISSTFESIFDYENNNYNRQLKKSETFYKGGKIIRLPYKLNILNKLRKHPFVYEILTQEKPDLIFVHDIHLNIKECAKYKKKHSSCTLIMDYHADYSNSAKNWISLYLLHKIIRKKILFKYIDIIEQFFPVTPPSSTFLHKVYGVPLDNMEILPLGYNSDLSHEILNELDKIGLRDSLGIKEKDFIIITGGKLDPLKKTDILINALKILKNPNIHLIIYGTSRNGHEDYFQILKNESKDMNIHFMGWLSPENILELMAISNIAIYPAGQSVMWQQSIGMHLPLIVGDLGGQNADYLNKRSNVIIIDKDNLTPNAFAEEIKKIYLNPSLEKKMKEGAKEVAKTYLDYRVICQRTIDIANS